MLYRSGQATDTLYIQGCSEETDIILFTIFTKPNVARMNFLMPNANAIHGNLFNRHLNFTFPTFQPREDIFDMAFVSAKLGYARRGRKGMSIFLGRRGVSKACFGLRPTYHLYSFRESCTSARVKTWQRGAKFTLKLWGGGKRLPGSKVTPTQFWRCKYGLVYFSNVQRTLLDGKIKSTVFTRSHAMTRHTIMSPCCHTCELQVWHQRRVPSGL